MSFFFGDNDPGYYVAPDTQISNGPPTGFLENFSAAYTEQAHVRSMLGAEDDMAQLEQQQLDRVYELTGERIKPIFGSATGYNQSQQIDALHSIKGDAIPDAGQLAYLKAVQEQTAKLSALATQHPELLDYQAMFKRVRDNAASDVAEHQNVSGRRDWAGVAGGIAGGFAGSMTYRDPINFMTLALGSVGKTALARVASEMGLQAVASAAEMLRGGYENQQLLDQPITPGEAAGQVTENALGAGALHVGGNLVAKGFGAVAKKFGARAPDVTAAALAHEAQDAIGPSPYGASDVATGLHHAEVMDAIARDTPYSQKPMRMPEFSASTFASRDTDQLFAGTSQPLANLFSGLPRASSKIVSAGNRKIATATRAIARFEQAAATVDEHMRTTMQADGVLTTPAIKIQRRQLAELDQQIASESNLRKLGQLNKARKDLGDSIDRAEKVRVDLDAMAHAKEDALTQAHALRLARADMVRAVADRLPGVRRSAAVNRLLGSPGYDPAAMRNTITRPLTPKLEEVEAASAPRAPDAPQPEGPKAKMIPQPKPEPVAGKSAPAAAEQPEDLVDVGQRSGPISLDTPIVIGVEHDAAGKSVPIMSTIRDILQDHADDDALVKAMRECLVA